MSAAAPAAALAPPPADLLLALADRCVQCGLCLPACPTYRLDRNETESPRGRIALARGFADGSLTPDPVADSHLDHCLGCRRCEAVCPAGVSYGELIVETRRRQRIRRGASLRHRAIEWLAARPALLDRLLGVYRLLYPLLPKLLPRPPARVPSPPLSPAATATVALFRGCVARRYDAGTHAAIATLCRAAGLAVSVPPDQTCCSALHAHAGATEAAQALAAANRAAFAKGIPVLTSATGCHASVAEALDGHAPVRDACDALLPHVERLRFRPSHGRVALHVPCTQRSVVRSDRALRTLLARIPGIDLVELPDTGCCGAAGTYLFDEPDRARELRAPLLDAYRASGATVLLSANVGCRLHLGNAGVPLRHPLEFLAAHLEAAAP